MPRATQREEYQASAGARGSMPLSHLSRANRRLSARHDTRPSCWNKPSTRARTSSNIMRSPCAYCAMARRRARALLMSWMVRAETFPSCRTKRVCETERVWKASAADDLSRPFSGSGASRTSHGATCMALITSEPILDSIAILDSNSVRRA